jgi:tRNA nucleotidyltransferase (CCA-adding enzyme)
VKYFPLFCYSSSGAKKFHLLLACHPDVHLAQFLHPPLTTLNQRISRLSFMPAFALSPQTWPFGLEWLPTSACLVGGSVRDALLERASDYLDLDFVLPQGAVETARTIAKHYRAGFVLLDAERQIARVVFAQGTADFAQQVGDSLGADLARRDFRANAIAYNPHTGELIDPLDGCQDLQHGLLRMVAPENLAEDPLRLLRAYRQAAQLGFSLDPETRDQIRQLAGELRRIAAERIQSELNYLLSTAKGTAWLKAAWEDGLLQAWLPNVTAEGLRRVGQIDRWVSDLKQDWPHFATELCRNIRSSSKTKSGLETAASGSARTWITTAKLACLLPIDHGAAEAQLWKLKYSRAEVQAVVTVLRQWPTLAPAGALDQSSDWVSERSLAEQYHFFQGVGTVFPALALCGLATGQPMAAMRMLINRFLDPADQVAHPTPLVTGQDLMQTLQLSPSPQIGKLLAALQLARAEEQIHTRPEALDLAQDLLNRSV